jgi:hypothetical protein
VREFLNLDLGDSFISVASNWLHEEKFYSVKHILPQLQS